jgi:hypothetical protein
MIDFKRINSFYSDSFVPSDEGTIVALRHPSGEDGGSGAEVLLEDRTEEGAGEDDRFIRCGQCLTAIAREEDEISMGGAHRHTFANPNGIVFEIGCFRSAGGCKYAGAPTGEFTWFPGWDWRIAVCGKCLSHLGWLYVSPGKDSFAGLIVDRLVYPE